MHEITMTIRYKTQSKPIKISIQVEKDNASCEEIAMLFAKELTRQYRKYIGATKSLKELKRYEFGQYKLILPYFEAKGE